MDKLAAAFEVASGDPDVQAKVRAQGIAPKVKTRAAFDAHIREDTKTLTPVIQGIASNTR
jgi:tripartite-type tricarboxylate transporter receptor subunit TctC